MRTMIFSAAAFMGLALFPGRACPQTWFPPEAVWHYGFADGFGGVGHVRVEVGADTVIAGTPCRTLLPV